MIEILFIKTSSMGDVLHHMPAITDVQRHFPAARLSWVVDELYAPLARLHPGTHEVLPVAVRRWRRQPYRYATWREIREAFGKLRTRRYDAIIDTQGLIRTGIITRLARGQRHGYDASSIREPFASRFYDIRHAISRNMHAIDRNRMLTALALGYEPDGPPDYGLERVRLAGDNTQSRAVLLHATARVEKEWPEQHWIEVGRSLAARGLEIVLPWGNPTERARSERIAAGVPGARVPALRPILEVTKLIAQAEIVIGVDTGFLHLAAALGVPLVAIVIHPKSLPTTPVGTGPIEVVGTGKKIPPISEVLAAIERVRA